MEFLHYPVMNKEVIDIFSQTEKEIFIDCTTGMGGHSYYILKNFKNTRIIAIDLDEDSINKAKINLKEFGDRVNFYQFNFIDLFDKEIFDEGKISGILIDPGISTYQLMRQNRGFSHQQNAPLDMRKDPSIEITAHDIIHSFKEKQLIDIFVTYGEVNRARELAKKIIEKRLFNSIDSTSKLREIIERVYQWKPRKGKVHPAAKVFQALRIFINRELEGIGDFLKKMPQVLNSGCRVVFLTYHSIEDRIVKQTFGFLQKMEKVKILKPFPAFPSENEVKINPSSRSAKLRAVEVL